LRTCRLGLGSGPSAEGANAVLPTPDQPLEDFLAEVERQAITQALEATRWNRTAAAKRLGISFRALRYRLEKLGLDTGEEAGDGQGQ
jgi:two-component system response regulator PilR (NtrC family)